MNIILRIFFLHRQFWNWFRLLLFQGKFVWWSLDISWMRWCTINIIHGLSSSSTLFFLEAASLSLFSFLLAIMSLELFGLCFLLHLMVHFLVAGIIIGWLVDGWDCSIRYVRGWTGWYLIVFKCCFLKGWVSFNRRSYILFIHLIELSFGIPGVFLKCL